MELGAFFVILAIILLVGLYIGRPFADQRYVGPLLQMKSKNMEKNQERSVLMAERDRILVALQELDFDHSLGKIPAADYPVQRLNLVKAGAEVLRALDAFEEVVESQTNSRRPVGKSSARRLVQPLDDIEAMIANRRQEHQNKPAGFCPKCGKPVEKSDRFCSRCGTTLE